MHFGGKIIKQKLQDTPILVGEGHVLYPKSGSGRTWAWCASGAMVLHFQGEFINKSCNACSK